MNQPPPQRRRHERFPFHNSVILVLNDGREIPGIADNMGYGGAAMTVTGPPPDIQQGTQGKLKVVFFGRPTDYPCTVVTANGIQLGLKIHRTEYEGAPEKILSIPE
ncbi:MAG: PilZ domain-containing protein [Magnetococcus sp. YQC-5]